MSASPTSHQARAVNFLPSGTGAIREPLESRGRWTVLVTDYMTDAERASLRAGSTVAADTAADAARTLLVSLGGGTIRFPSGHYSLNNWRYRNGIVIEGDGKNATFIHQGAAANPAIYCLADATTGQLYGVGFKNCRVIGHASASSPAVKVEATTPYVVTWGDFDYDAQDTFNVLEIVTTAAVEVYLSNFKVNSSGSSGTAFITKGVYNVFDLSAVNCASGQAISDSSLNSVFTQPVTDGRQLYSGQNCLVSDPAVETIFGTAGDYAIGANGFNNTLVNPIVQEVTAAKAVASFLLGNFNNFINPRVLGTNFPVYSFDLVSIANDTNRKSTIVGGHINCSAKLVQHATSAMLDAVVFLGDNSSYYGKGQDTFYVEERDDFLGDVLADQWNGRVGSDPQCVTPTILADQVRGVVRAVTGDDAAATMAVNGVQLERALNWSANQGGLVLEAKVKMSAITAAAVFVGLTDQVAALEMPFTLGAGNALTSNASDAVGVLFDTAADTDTWWLVGVAADVDAAKQDTTLAPVADTYETWRIELSSAGVATFYRNGVAIGTTMTGAVTASVALTPVIAAFSRGAASRNIDSDYILTKAIR